MHSPTVSIITPVYQSDTFERCRESVISQTIPVQHIVIDGGSSPSRLKLYKSLLGEGDRLVSESDNGIYDALNKGIRISTGEIIGILHSDDVFASETVLETVRKEIAESHLDYSYGDLEYITLSSRRVRYWKGGSFRSRSLFWGWMPPHPTVFVKRTALEVCGYYDPSFKIAGDYDFTLRLFESDDLKGKYIASLITRMTIGGTSNRSASAIMAKSREDLKVMRKHRLNPLITLPAKNLRKIVQFLPQRDPNSPLGIVLKHNGRNSIV